MNRCKSLTKHNEVFAVSHCSVVTVVYGFWLSKKKTPLNILQMNVYDITSFNELEDCYNMDCY